MADIFSIGVSALNVYQRALNITSHNVANANTEGYSRQYTEPVASEPNFYQGAYVGTGVKNTNIERAYDAFMLGQVRASQSAQADMAAYYKIGSQMEQLLADEQAGLDPALQDFFDTVQALADDPAATPVRELLLAESQALVDRFHFLDRNLVTAREQVHFDLQNAVQDINNLADTIAQLNETISASPGIHDGIWPNDLLDQRDQAITELSRYVNINVADPHDGTLTVYLGRGQPLVFGTESRKMAVVNSPVEPNHLEIAYQNRGTYDIISDQIAGGELEGLLRARDQVLTEGRNRLGLVALGLSFEVNAQHREGINLMNQTGLDFFSDLTLSQSRGSNLNAPATDYRFDILVTDPANLPAADFSLEYLGGAANNLSSYRLTNLTEDSPVTIAAPPVGFPWDLSADLGIEIDLSLGTSISAGDIFFFSPTAEAAGRIGLEIHDPQAIAAGSPIEVTPADGEVTLPSIVNVSAVPVQLSNPVTLTYTGPDFDVDLDGDAVVDTTLSYDPATQSDGQTFQLNMGGYELQFTISGYPAVGDVFTFDNGGIARPSDNRNAQLIADLQAWQGMLGGSANLQDTFGNYVAHVGSRTRQSELNLQAQDRMLELNKESLLSITGVNMDEEAANLIRYGQAYQAAAQVISTASKIFDSLLSSMR